MTRSFDWVKFIFVILLIFCISFIFTVVFIEENLYDHEKRPDYDTLKNELPTTKRFEIDLPIISKVKLPIHNQEDPELVKDLASKIIPPCAYLRPYAHRKPERAGIGESEHIKKLSNAKGDRFFLECGAGDGESLSNTLYLEKYLYWKGLLVEGDPAHFHNMISLHRKAWIAPVCMSLNTSAYVADFKTSLSFKGKVVTNGSVEEEDVVKVICYPFYTFVLALNIKRIDYLSLSVQGHETEILETIPFHKVEIAFVSVNISKARGGSEGITSFMHRQGYDMIMEYSPSELVFVNIDEDYW